MASNNISLENSIRVFPRTFSNKEVEKRTIYQQRLKVANFVIGDALKKTGLEKEEIKCLIETLPELWLKLSDDYPMAKIAAGVKNAYEKTRREKKRNPGVREILTYIDSKINLERYIQS